MTIEPAQIDLTEGDQAVEQVTAASLVEKLA